MCGNVVNQSEFWHALRSGRFLRLTSERELPGARQLRVVVLLVGMLAALLLTGGEASAHAAFVTFHPSPAAISRLHPAW